MRAVNGPVARVGDDVADSLRTGGRLSTADLAAADTVRTAWRAELDSVFSVLAA